MWKFLTDDQLDNIDRYKDIDLIKAINECNTYVQADTKITITENVGDKNINIVRGTGPLHLVMDFVNEEAIPREALIESMYKLNMYMSDSNAPDPTSTEGECIGFAINLLYDLLSKNTLFIPYRCVKTFRPKASDTDNNVEKDDSLSLTNKYVSAMNVPMNVLFNFNLGEWIYITDDEMDNLEKVDVLDNN